MGCGRNWCQRRAALSQSTISLHIKRLEEELRCPLFLRAKKRVYLNEAGGVLLQYADRIFREIKNAEMAVRELSELQCGTIRLGSGATTVTYLLPRILGAYQRKYPEIELIVTTNSSEALALAVHQQKLDLAVVMLPVQPSLALELLSILREELVYVVHSNHPLAAKQVIHPQDILEIPFISFLQGSAMQMNLDTHFAAMGIAPRITMEMENIEAIKALVRAGIGAAVLPACSVSPTHGTIRPLRIRGFRMECELALALPKATVLPQAIQKLASSGSTLTQTFVLMFGLQLSSRKQLTPCGGSLFSLLRLTGSILH